uniref:RMT2 domain-containing protein n=1 Tax=Macrostomum lignano TaxID=282301 RepID=A0A1I8JQ03_9PLAT
MMAWEQPLMERHASYICPRPGLRVLNVGFGMGIVDTELQKLGPASHTIVEAHPDVLARMRDQGWPDKPGVRIVSGRWQDVVADLGPFDGDDLDLHSFHAHLPRLLAPGGRYAFYNGMCPDNVFFHAVACEVVRLRLLRLGLRCTFRPLPVKVDDAKLWQGVRDRYWHFDTYYLPEVCRPRRRTASQPRRRWMPVPRFEIQSASSFRKLLNVNDKTFDDVESRACEVRACEVRACEVRACESDPRQ